MSKLRTVVDRGKVPNQETLSYLRLKADVTETTKDAWLTEQNVFQLFLFSTKRWSSALVT